jgi:flagellar basal body rod protein FlgG
MNRAIYPILSGAVAQEKQLTVFANNLANVNTAGFKQDQQGFRGLFARASSTGWEWSVRRPLLRHFDQTGRSQRTGVCRSAWCANGL